MKKLTKHRKKELIYLSAALVLLSTGLFFINFYAGLICLAVSALILVLFYVFIIGVRNTRANEIYEILKTIKSQKQPLVIGDDMPSAITDKKNIICWYNHAFAAIMDETPRGKDINELCKDISRADVDKKVEIAGTVYTKDVAVLSTKSGHKYSLLRFIDKQNEEDIRQAYMGHIGVISYIQIDNYEELASNLSQSVFSSMIAEIDKMIADYAAMINGVYRQYEKDKYVMICEKRHIGAAISNRFSLLQNVRSYKVEGLNATLSIAIGIADTLSESENNAFKALELAQSRGGDQAVLKQYDKYNFFGGRQLGMEKRSRVKVRQFAKGLRNLMEQSSDVFIMGHSSPDLDSLGAALGVLSCARSIDKKAYIVVDRTAPNISAIMDAIKPYKEYLSILISGEEALDKIKATSMAVVVDTQIKSYLEKPELIEKTENIVVIDHHFRGTDFIDNAALFCHEPYASSTCEIVAETIQYFADRPNILPVEADALLAGISLDTKGFTFKTGVRTFEAASFLRRMGADTISIKQLFQDDMETFSAMAQVVSSAKTKKGIAVSEVSDKIDNPALIAAQAADSLLNIKGVQASFVLSSADNNILISARSLGAVNVQIILEKLGGGGHPTISGARIKNASMQETREKLEDEIQKYLSEEENKQ